MHNAMVRCYNCFGRQNCLYCLLWARVRKTGRARWNLLHRRLRVVSRTQLMKRIAVGRNEVHTGGRNEVSHQSQPGSVCIPTKFIKGSHTSTEQLRDASHRRNTGTSIPQSSFFLSLLVYSLSLFHFYILLLLGSWLVASTSCL